jgi:choline kinase
VRAILLAAGRGRRLGIDGPKCLVPIAGKSLLERHLANMPEAGITALTIVVGFQQSMIRDELARLAPAIAPGLAIELVENPRFVHGSIVSLQVASDRLLEGAIWMDADVFYPPALLGRLVATKHDSSVLLDARSDETGEEMMLGTIAGRVHQIARRVGKTSPDGTPWDVVGEAVGFAKAGPKGGAVLKRILDAEVEAGRLDQEYEAAMNTAFGETEFGFERVDDFAWTEIDFQEDVAKAEALARS